MSANAEWWKRVNFGLRIKQLVIENVGISGRFFLAPILGILSNVEFSWDRLRIEIELSSHKKTLSVADT